MCVLQPVFEDQPQRKCVVSTAAGDLSNWSGCPGSMCGANLELQLRTKLKSGPKAVRLSFQSRRANGQLTAAGSHFELYRHVTSPAPSNASGVIAAPGCGRQDKYYTLERSVLPDCHWILLTCTVQWRVCSPLPIDQCQDLTKEQLQACPVCQLERVAHTQRSLWPSSGAAARP